MHPSRGSFHIVRCNDEVRNTILEYRAQASRSRIAFVGTWAAGLLTSGAQMLLCAVGKQQSTALHRLQRHRCEGLQNERIYLSHERRRKPRKLLHSKTHKGVRHGVFHLMDATLEEEADDGFPLPAMHCRSRKKGQWRKRKKV